VSPSFCGRVSPATAKTREETLPPLGPTVPEGGVVVEPLLELELELELLGVVLLVPPELPPHGV